MSTCDDHVEGPDNYSAWHEWAKRHAKTHVQSRCDECGLWAIWTPKVGVADALPTDATPALSGEESE